MTRLAILCAALLVSTPALADAPRDTGSVQFRLGGFFLEGDGTLWAVNQEIFTLDASDFDDAMLGFSYVGAVNNHLEIGFNIDFYDATFRSAYRGITDNLGLAILHDTRLQSTPITVDFRLLPGGRYRMRGPDGRYPVRKPVIYLGGGVGLNLWEYEEVGDFIDADDFIVFDRVKDSGAALETHVLAGVELPVGPRWSLLFEGRYSWSDDDPSLISVDPFLFGRGELDLSGGAFFVGGSVRF